MHGGLGTPNLLRTLSAMCVSATPAPVTYLRIVQGTWALAAANSLPRSSHSNRALRVDKGQLVDPGAKAVA
jgi:hypothetical protein